MARRREVIKSRVEEGTLQSNNTNHPKYVTLSDKNKYQDIKSEIDSILSKIRSLYIKCNDKGKRKILWYMWEKHRGNFESYQEFKENVGTDLTIRTEINRLWEINRNPFASNKDIYRRC